MSQRCACDVLGLHHLTQRLVVRERGAPAHVRSDNGPEFIAKSIRPGCPATGPQHGGKPRRFVVRLPSTLHKALDARKPGPKGAAGINWCSPDSPSNRSNEPPLPDCNRGRID